MMGLFIIDLFDLKRQGSMKQNSHQPRSMIGFLLLLSLLPTLVCASEPSLVLGPDIPYNVLVENEQSLTFDEVRQRLQDVERSQREIFAAGYVDDVFWLAFHIPQQTFQHGERWLRLAPNYLDHLRLYYREAGSGSSWQRREVGDLSPSPRGDLDYRFPVLRLPSPERGDGYEFIVRLQSTSATLLHATVWDPGSFMNADRLLWSIFTFSVSYVVVACIQGHVDWLLPATGFHLQHYLTSISVLLAYPTLLWVAAEGLRLREHLPRVYAWVIGTAIAISTLLISIPLDFFGRAMMIQGAVYFCTAIALLLIAAYIIWIERFKLSTLLMAASPLLLMAASVMALSSVYGLIRFDADVYLLWQYMLVVNMLLVMTIAISRILRQRREEKANEQLAHELDVEREARFHQRQFMGMVSHEFRTPISIMSATLQNLRGGELKREQQEVRFQKMERAVDRLTQLTDNCLADARLSAGSLYLERHATCLHELVHFAAAIASLSDRHQLEIVVDGHAMQQPILKGLRIIVDPALMRIALANVIDNAVKYSVCGNVRVECRTNDGFTTVSVSDEGEGIPASIAPYIFERYRRTSPGRANHQGVGLGLYVARQIVEAHGGRLELAENSKRGCRFDFTIPQYGRGAG